MASRDEMKDFADRAEKRTGARFDGPLPSDKTKAHFMSERLSASERKSDRELKGRLDKIK